MKDETVAVMPCVDFQRELILYLMRKYKSVIAVQPFETAETKIATRHVKCDIIDLDTLERELAGVTRIYTDQSDMAVLPAAKLSERLKISHNSVDAVSKFSGDKHKMYCHAQSVGIPVGDFQLIEDLEDFQFGYMPFVFKPCNSSNSRGVYCVSKREEIGPTYEKVKSFTNGPILAQKKLDGLQITIEGINTQGKHFSLAHSYKGPYLEFAFTSSLKWAIHEMLDHREIKELSEQNDYFVNTTGIGDCITHAEYIYSGGKFHLNEIACRGGGFFISSHIVPHVKYLNMYDFLYQGWGVPHNWNSGKKDRSAIMKFYRGRVTKCKIPGVIHSAVKEPWTKHEDNPRGSYAIILADNNQDLEDKIKGFENECLHND